MKALRVFLVERSTVRGAIHLAKAVKAHRMQQGLCTKYSERIIKKLEQAKNRQGGK